MTLIKAIAHYVRHGCIEAHHGSLVIRQQGGMQPNNFSMEANQSRLTDFLKQHPCVDCGENDIIVLEFDHRADKSENVSRAVSQGWSWKRIMTEINKCDVRCRNCHVRRTNKQHNSYKVKASEQRP